MIRISPEWMLCAQKISEYITEHGGVSSREIAGELKLKLATVVNYLYKLKMLGYLRTEGGGNKVVYFSIRKYEPEITYTSRMNFDILHNQRVAFKVCIFVLKNPGVTIEELSAVGYTSVTLYKFTNALVDAGYLNVVRKDVRHFYSIKPFPAPPPPTRSNIPVVSAEDAKMCMELSDRNITQEFGEEWKDGRPSQYEVGKGYSITRFIRFGLLTRRGEITPKGEKAIESARNSDVHVSPPQTNT